MPEIIPDVLIRRMAVHGVLHSRSSILRHASVLITIMLLAPCCSGSSALRGGAGGWFAGFFGGDHGQEETVLRQPSPMNASDLVQLLAGQRNLNNASVVVNFFSGGSCPFSAELAPLFGALPQVFSEEVRFIAIDAHADHQLNMRYGIGGYPTVVCFVAGRLRASYSDKPSLQALINFVKQHTNSTPLCDASSVQLESSVHEQLDSCVSDTRLLLVSALAGGCLLHMLVEAWQATTRRRRINKDK
jgi:thiol-disulfide isomerase/thioredoxin